MGAAGHLMAQGEKTHCGKVPTQEVMLLFFPLSSVFLASGVILHFHETFGLGYGGRDDSP